MLANDTYTSDCSKSDSIYKVLGSDYLYIGIIDLKAESISDVVCKAQSIKDIVKYFLFDDSSVIQFVLDELQEKQVIYLPTTIDEKKHWLKFVKSSDSIVVAIFENHLAVVDCSLVPIHDTQFSTIIM